VIEAGIKGFEVVGFYGFLAPAGTPKDVVAKLSDAFKQVLAMPDVRNRMITQGADPAFLGSDDFAKFLAAEMPRWAEAVKNSIAEDDQLMLGSTGFDGNSSLLGLSGVTAHCPDHASFLDDSSDTEGEPSAHGQACTVCQVCHTVAMSAEAMAFATLSLPLIAPQASAPRFTSALPAPGLKPPIS
jgi:hypothetical protein